MTSRQIINTLFVEDDALDVELAVRALERDRLQVFAQRVDTERDLRRALAESRPDVVLSDFTMPQFDGLQALRIARGIAPQLPFIFLSGTIGEEKAIEAIRLGATDYVLKSNMRRLGTAVRRALEEAAERQRTQAAEGERSRLIEILEATSDFVGMADQEGRPTYLNAAGRRMLGLGTEGLARRNIREFYAEGARALAEREGRLAAMRDGTWQGETALKSTDGTEIPVSQVIIAHHAPDRSVRFFSTIARDISERKAFEKRIEYLANYDDLCGLPNRTLLADRVVQAITYARRKKRYCALLVTNFDRFKRVNESYGHGAGDLVLKAFGARLCAALREGDTVARLPGAFAVLAADLARAEDVHGVARKVMDAAIPNFEAAGIPLHLTVSVGASIFPEDGDDFEALLRGAEAARNGAKAGGGNRFQCFANEMTRETAERMEIESALRTAAEQGGLQMHYQPQVEIASGRIVGAEALMRWQHARLGWVSPARFIPIAEESDLIVTLGKWALMQAGRQLAHWRRAGLAPLRVAVNVSARQFRDAGFVEAVASAVRENEVDPACLELELTEGVLIDDRARASAILDELRKLGVAIAVDDFGTGYSSLNYLSSLPIDCLKIDRSFVKKIAKGGRDMAIVQAIISLARALGLTVIAEGVETMAERDFLQEHGCHEAQGFLFSPATDADSVSVLLKAGIIPAKSQNHGGG